MLSRERLEEYGRMSVSERYQLTTQMIRENISYLLRGSPELVARRFEILRQQNDDCNRRILEHPAQLKASDDRP